MSSPPSLSSLKLSDSTAAPSASTSTPLSNGIPPSSPSSSPEDATTNSSIEPKSNGISKPDVNGVHEPSAELTTIQASSAEKTTSDESSSSAQTIPQSQPPQPTPSSSATPSQPKPPVNGSQPNGQATQAKAQRPGLPPMSTAPPGASAFSPPNAGRPSVQGAGPMGMNGRGGMPMPMGMRGQMGRGGAMNQMPVRVPASLQAKFDREVASRSGAAPSPQLGGVPSPNATSMSALLRSQALGGGRNVQGPNAGPLGLAARRAGPGGPPRPTLGQMGQSTPGGLGRPGGPGGPAGLAGRRGPPGGLNLSGMKGAPKADDNKFTDFGKIMDPSGSLRFSKKAVLHSKGVDFEDGKSFSINMDEIEVVGELGRGNYGSVQKVYHRPMGVFMAMKEIRLELDESKLAGIIMELDILHRAQAPEIVEFYGAFTIESCVYYCMELMDAGSLDTITGGGQPAKAGAADQNDEGATDRVPEAVLRRVTLGMVKGLKFLKDELQIMHRDVKPTNVLINKKGEVKLCDFGVSGQLEKSLAKTNIGCQSYMAPERIKGESQNQLSTYTVSSDVWSVGLSIIELAKGCYPYPPETFANVFAQLTAIVNGPAPTLPVGYSDDAQDFVAKCLLKDPNARPTYAQLLEHPFLLADKDSDVDMAAWVAQALERRAERGVVPIATVEA